MSPSLRRTPIGGIQCRLFELTRHLFGLQRQFYFARLAKVCGSRPRPFSPRILTAPLVFISEITARAFIIADSNKRRTLSRADIAKALSKSDQFDFLIDIVPRDDLPFPGASSSNGTAGKKNANIAAPKTIQVRCDLRCRFSITLNNFSSNIRHRPLWKARVEWIWKIGKGQRGMGPKPSNR